MLNDTFECSNIIPRSILSIPAFISLNFSRGAAKWTRVICGSLQNAEAWRKYLAAMESYSVVPILCSFYPGFYCQFLIILTISAFTELLCRAAGSILGGAISVQDRSYTVPFPRGPLWKWKMWWWQLMPAMTALRWTSLPGRSSAAPSLRLQPISSLGPL